MTTREEFSIACLTKIAKPTCQNNLLSLVCWQVSEGSNAIWNPFDTERNEAGDTDYNSAGVKDYPSEAVGVQAFADTILNGLYANILADLQACAPMAVTCSHIENSEWGSKPNSALQAQVALDYQTYADQLISGSIESEPPVTPPNPTPVQDATGGSIPAAIVAGFPARDGQGWYAVGADGSVYAQDGAVDYGSMKGSTLNKPIVAAWATSSGKGYVLLAGDGGTFNFGDGNVPAL